MDRDGNTVNGDRNMFIRGEKTMNGGRIMANGDRITMNGAEGCL